MLHCTQGLNKITNVGLADIGKHCTALTVLRVGGRLNFEKTAGTVTAKAAEAGVKR
jgi:hypothetical protein